MIAVLPLVLGSAAQITHAAHYDEHRAVEDIWLNQAVGCDAAKLESWSCGPACKAVPIPAPRLVASSKKEETLALVARRTPQECVIVVRGTKNTWNAIMDADIFLDALPGCMGCKVHSGFLAGWRSLEDQIIAHLGALGCQNSTTSITGHSLGAAIATLATLQLANSSGAHWPLGRVYTYGQPRVGNLDFVHRVNSVVISQGIPFYRVVDYRDAVPHLPPDNFLREGWEHAGPEIYYNATALHAYTFCAEARDRRCSYQWALPQTLTHTCDHCSYLGMNPCTCGATQPRCKEPHALTRAESLVSEPR